MSFHGPLAGITMSRSARSPSLSAPLGARRARGPLSFASGGMNYAAMDTALHMQPQMALPEYMMQHMDDGGSVTPNWDEYERNLGEAARRVPGDMARNVWPALKGMAHSIPSAIVGQFGDFADIANEFGVAPDWAKSLPNTEQVQSYLPGYDDKDRAYDTSGDVGSFVGGSSDFGAFRKGVKALQYLKKMGKVVGPVAGGVMSIPPSVEAYNALTPDSGGVMGRYVDPGSEYEAVAKRYRDKIIKQRLDMMRMR